MNMKKRIFALILASFILIAITACSTKNGETDNSVTKVTTNNGETNDPTENADLTESEEIPEYITIGGMSFSTDLTELDLASSNLTDSDIEPLKYMVNLKILHLRNNQISDISVVTGLTNLTRLYLQNNQISDISAVAGLTNLTFLYAYNNQISDISAVTELTNLEEFLIDGNKINDISAIAGLTNLVYFSIAANPISEVNSFVSVLSGLTKLKKVWLQGISINAEQMADLRAPLPYTEFVVN